MSVIKSGRGRVAALSRSRHPNDPELVKARRDLAANVIAQHAAKVVAKAPPLTAEQRDRIAAILRAGDATLVGGATRTDLQKKSRAEPRTTEADPQPTPPAAAKPLTAPSLA
jgi:hypothetical protein